MLTPLLAWVSLKLFGLSLPGLRLWPALAAGATVVISGLTARELGGGPGTDLEGFFTSITPVATLSNPAGIHNQEQGGQIYLCIGPVTPWAQLLPLLRHYD